jgi:hypothetical protein
VECPFYCDVCLVIFDLESSLKVRHCMRKICHPYICIQLLCEPLMFCFVVFCAIVFCVLFILLLICTVEDGSRLV